jgi:hypothetical protein
MQDRKTLRRSGELHTHATLRVISHMLDTIGAAETAELEGVRDPTSPGAGFMDQDQSAIAERMGASPKFILDSTSTSLKTVFAAVQEESDPPTSSTDPGADLAVPDMDGDTAAMLLSLQENASKIAAKLAVQVRSPPSNPNPIFRRVCSRLSLFLSIHVHNHSYRCVSVSVRQRFVSFSHTIPPH